MPPVPEPDRPVAAVVLAGGRGRRLGGLDKPALVIDGATLLDRVLAALDGVSTVVVGPSRTLPPHVRQTVEDPPGSGPAAGLAVGLRMLPHGTDTDPVAVLAADLPAVRADTLIRLTRALAEAGAVGALLTDETGRDQLLCGVWHRGHLMGRLAARTDWADRSIREFLETDLAVRLPAHREPAAPGSEASDIDTPQDVSRWTRPPQQSGPFA